MNSTPNNQTPKILVIGTQHGNERLGPRIQRAIQRDQSGKYDTVDYLCGNPRAYRQNVRFIQTDLNRSYDTLPATTYEQKRAQKILRLIREQDYDYVLDIHTSHADVDRFFLATSLNEPIRRMVAASNFSRVAIMPPQIADCSLIGQVRQAISIEYARPLAATPQAVQEVMALIDNLLAGKTTPKQREIYYVTGKIPLSSRLDYSARNFELSNEGFYPVIFSRTSSYTEYKGFAAERKELAVM
jgi:predicted deacylase